MKTLNEDGKLTEVDGRGVAKAVDGGHRPPLPAGKRSAGVLTGGYRPPSHHAVCPLTGAWTRMTMEAPTAYDRDYVEKYNAYPCGAMSELRWDLVRDHCAKLKSGLRLLDFGCGNGAFIQYAQGSKFMKPQCYGYDVSGYEPPKVKMIAPGMNQEAFFLEMKQTPAFDVITFFDSLEHVEDLHGLLSTLLLKTTYVVVSLPWCHGPELGPEWFNAWKHNRPTEHWHYFGPASLCNRMKLYGFKPVFIGNPEDAVRKGPDHLPNILTGVFEKDFSAN